MNTFLLSLKILCAAGLLGAVASRFFSVMKGCYVALTVIGCLIGALAAFSQLGAPAAVGWSTTWLQTFPLSFSIDSLSAFFLIPIFLVCPLAILYSFHYFSDETRSLRVGLNFLFTNLLVISMALVATADNIISLALVWEMMSLSSFLLVMFDYEKETTRKAGYIYLIFTQAGAMFLFAAMGVAFSVTGSYDFAAFSAVPEAMKLTVFFLALVGFGSKAGIFPLHMWLPHAHPAAPSNISAIMSGVMIKMGIYGIIRFYLELASDAYIVGQIVLLLGMVSGVLGVVYALGKHDLKKLLAYHSVENIGIILIGAGIGMIGLAAKNPVMAGFGFAGSLLHVLNHSIFKSLLFLGAGAVLKATGIRHIDELGGLMKRMPKTGKTFLIGSISISGLPPFNGFISEFLIYFGAFQGLALHGSSFIFAMLAILALAMIGGLAAACFAKVVGIVFLGEPRCEKAAAADEVSFTMTVSMIILATSCLIIGVFPSVFVNLAFSGISALAALPGNAQVDPALVSQITGNLSMAALVLFFCIGLTIAVRKYFYSGKEITKAPTWGCGFTQPNVRMQYTGTSFAMSVVEFFGPLVKSRSERPLINRIFPGKTRYSSRVDDIAEIALVDQTMTPLVYLIGKLRWIQHGQIHLYIGYIFVTIIVLLLLLVV